MKVGGNEIRQFGFLNVGDEFYFGGDDFDERYVKTGEDSYQAFDAEPLPEVDFFTKVEVFWV